MAQQTLLPAASRGAGRDAITLVDTAAIPGGGMLELLKCGSEFSIHFGQDELMGSEFSHSEQALATLVCKRLDARPHTVLIGGLGMGFTLRAALAALPANATVVVAELVPEVLEWANGHLAHLFGDMLADPRVSIEIGDVHDMIAAAPEGFDAILMDVDNGPDGFMRPANDRIYCNWGLRSAHAALRPGGLLGVWSAYPDAAFVERLTGAGFAVEEVAMDQFADENGRDIIWLATRVG